MWDSYWSGEDESSTIDGDVLWVPVFVVLGSMLTIIAGWGLLAVLAR